MHLATTVLLFPCESSRSLADLLDNASKPNMKIDAVVAIDATWQYAQEMVNRCEVLKSLQAVTVTSDQDPQFLVRKPARIGDKILGHSTAEAVSIALDQIA